MMTTSKNFVIDIKIILTKLAKARIIELVDDPETEVGNEVFIDIYKYIQNYSKIYVTKYLLKYLNIFFKCE